MRENRNVVRATRRFGDQIFACVPSQKGLFPVLLHAHQAITFSSSMVTGTGENSVPAWEPSQKGWVFDRPQAHHHFSPGVSCWTMGDFCGHSGSADIG